MHNKIKYIKILNKILVEWYIKVIGVGSNITICIFLSIF